MGGVGKIEREDFKRVLVLWIRARSRREPKTCIELATEIFSGAGAPSGGVRGNPAEGVQ